MKKYNLKPVRYFIVRDNTINGLINKVQDRLNDGWNIEGGVAIDNRYAEYYQAMSIRVDPSKGPMFTK